MSCSSCVHYREIRTSGSSFYDGWCARRSNGGCYFPIKSCDICDYWTNAPKEDKKKILEDALFEESVN